MSDPSFCTPEEPSDLSIRLLTLSLQSDCEKKGVSSKNYAHRARVIRQQTELLGRRKATTVEEVATRAAHDVMDNEGAYVRSGEDRS